MEAADVRAVLTQRARLKLWRQGELSWKLDACKRAIHTEIGQLEPYGQHVIEACRKLGKSFLYCVVACETALKHPGARINYACPTGKMASEIVLPIMAEIQADAPDDCLARYNVQTGHFTWPNGAYMVLFGCEDQAKADRGRGPQAILSIVDEAGFVPVLEYVLGSVLAPQHLRTGGPTLAGSTPPLSPGHDFCAIADGAIAAGTYAHRDIFSAGIEGIPDPSQYIAARARAKGMSVEAFKRSTEYKREFLALRVTDAESAVVPEWEESAADCVQERERPPYFAPAYVVDPGFVKDMTGAVFGYYDFRGQVLVVEDELMLKRAGTREIGDSVTAKLADLYGQMNVDGWLDDPGRMASDLSESHKMSAGVIGDKNREADLGNVRLVIGNRKVRIHPRCVALIRQLRQAVFAVNGKDWERTALDGHQDVLAAFVYFCRLAPRHNPYPTDYDFLQAGPNAHRPDTSWHQKPPSPFGASATHKLLRGK